MRYSALKVGDVLQDHTAHGRTYSKTITKVGFKYRFGHKSFANGEYKARAFEVECEGKLYISEVYPENINSEMHSVIRGGKFLVK